MKAMHVSMDKRDFQAVQGALLEDDFDLMVLAESSGLFRQGRVTFTIVLEEERLDRALELIRSSVASNKDPGVDVLIFDLEDHLRL